jgi:hypothetical protein
VSLGSLVTGHGPSAHDAGTVETGDGE